MKVFLDDQRSTPEGWTRVFWPDQAIDILKTGKVKELLSLDHAGFNLLESPLSDDQQVIDEDETYLIMATVVDSDMLDWWLRGFGDAVMD